MTKEKTAKEVEAVGCHGSLSGMFNQLMSCHGELEQTRNMLVQAQRDFMELYKAMRHIVLYGEIDTAREAFRKAQESPLYNEEFINV